jgi:DNA-binding CsgD family transcriptional regulator
MTEKLRKQLKLSKQQALLLELLKLGYNNADIALAMKISEHTVKVHMWRMYPKLGVKDRLGAVRWYYEATYMAELKLLRDAADAVALAAGYIRVSAENKPLLDAALLLNKAAINGRVTLE